MIFPRTHVLFSIYSAVVVRLGWADVDTLEVSAVFSLKYFEELVPVSIRIGCRSERLCS